MKLFYALVSILSISGCLGYYHHTVMNIGEKPIDHVTVKCGERNFSHGIVIPNSQSGYSGSLKLSKKNIITISWILDGKKYLKEINIVKNPGSKEVVFKLDGNDVVVEYRDLD